MYGGVVWTTVTGPTEVVTRRKLRAGRLMGFEGSILREEPEWMALFHDDDFKKKK